MSDALNIFQIKNGEKVYTYHNKEEYEKDIADGVLDGEVDGKEINGFLQTAWDGVATFFNKPSEIELTESEVALIESLEANKNKLNVLERRYNAVKSQVINLETKSKNNLTTIEALEKDNDKNTETIEKKEAKIQELQKEIAKYEAEQKELKNKNLNEAIAKAEKEYDPQKHGEDKDAFIAKEVSHVANQAIEPPQNLIESLSAIQSEIRSLQNENSNNSKSIGNKQTLNTEFSNISDSKKIEMQQIADDIAIVQADINVAEAAQKRINKASTQNNKNT